MSLKQRIETDLVTALKARDAETTSTLRMMKADILNKEKEGAKGTVLDDATITSLIQSAIKRRKEAAEQFRKGNRPEMASKEEAEMTLLLRYLPPEASPEEIRAAVEKAIAETGATSRKELGKVMGKAMGILKEGDKTVDGTRVRETAASLLD
jgi:hypothetical protein